MAESVRTVKRQVEDCLSIDSRTMRKNGVFGDHPIGTWEWPEYESRLNYSFLDSTLTLQFSINGQTESQIVNTNTTPCNYGHHRHWFLCPGHECGKRIAKLYLVDNKFLCRHCHKLNYLIQQCRKTLVPVVNMSRIELKLNWPSGGLVPQHKRLCPPPHMHKKTFALLVSKYEEYEQQRDSWRGSLIDKLKSRL